MFSVIKLASETLTENYNPSIFNYFYETFPQGFIIAEKNHKIIGFIVGVPITQKNVKILMLSISDAQRRKKIGTQLLVQFLKETNQKNIEKIELEVKINNYNAIKFYQKNGFKIIEELKHFYQNGENAYLMKKIV